MGWAHKHDTEAAGSYLLALLQAQGGVKYSRFYDGTDETEKALLKGMGYSGKYAADDSQDEEELPDSPAAYMDHAVVQLAQQGIVKTTTLDEKLADDEQDYLIELTEAGRKAVLAGKKPRYWDIDL